MTVSVDGDSSKNLAAAKTNGIIRGGYHIGQPNEAGSDGAAQANYFIQNGGLCIPLCMLFLLSLSEAGGWTSDGGTLPGAVRLDGTFFSLLIPENILTLRVFP